MKRLADFHQNNLTLGAENERAILETFPGMAHIAGSGPTGKTCGGCKRWAEDGPQYYASGALKPDRCGKFHAMMRDAAWVSTARSVPHTAAACMFFDERTTPVPIKNPAMVERAIG